jgi:hypothetical protein
MLRTSALLAIGVSLATLGSFAAPAAAFAGASTQVRPIQIQAGRLPLPPRTPTVRQPYCATHDCIIPPRNLGGR